MLLGIAIQKELYDTTPASRLAQQERAWAAAGSPKLPPAIDPVAWANFDAGQLRRAEELANLQLEICAKQNAMHQPDFFQHSAESLIGLIRLQGGSSREAAAMLQQSLDIQPGIMFLSSRPAVRLADGLWKRGETEAVLRYLERASAMQWTSPITKPEIQKWLAEARAGQPPSFFGLSRPVPFGK